MSKRSKNRRKRLQDKRSSEPITGDMATRASEIIRQDNQNKKGDSRGDRKVDSKFDSRIDSRLPIHYGGYGSYQTMNGDKNVSNLSNQSNQKNLYDNVGYVPVDKKQSNQNFRIVSADITTGECPIVKIPKVYLTTKMWNEWIALASDYDTEWIAYLIGRFVKDDKGPRYEIEKMYFPPQKARSTHVEVDDDFEGYLPNTIGAVHSHVNMNVFFSGEDLAHSNWPVEVVVNAKGEAKVMIRHQLECSRWIKNYSEIITMGDNADEKYIAALNKAFERGKLMEAGRRKKIADGAGYRTPMGREKGAADIQVNQADTQANQANQANQAIPSCSSSTVPIAKHSDGSLVTYEKDKEWHFHIGGKPSKWSDKRQAWVGVIKIDGKWYEVGMDGRVDMTAEAEVEAEDNPINVDSEFETAHTTIDLNDLNDLTGIVEIDEETGQIMVTGSDRSSDDGSDLETRPATQAEIDRMLENDVDRELERLDRQDEIAQGDFKHSKHSNNPNNLKKCVDCRGTGTIIAVDTVIDCLACGGTGNDPTGNEGNDWMNQGDGYGEWMC